MTSENAITAATNSVRNPTITLYSGGNWVQFSARNLPSGTWSTAARKNENVMDAMPTSRRIVPWTQPRMKHPNRPMMMSTSTMLIVRRNSVMFTHPPS